MNKHVVIVIALYAVHFFELGAVRLPAQIKKKHFSSQILCSCNLPKILLYLFLSLRDSLMGNLRAIVKRLLYHADTTNT